MEVQADSAVSTVLTTAQTCGAFLNAIVLAYLARLHRTAHARTWAAGFAALAVALASVRAYIAWHGRGWWAVYLVAEWTFGVCFVAGCREFAGGSRLRPQRLLAALPAAALLALALVRFPHDFNALFTGQAVVIAGLAAFAFLALGGAPAALRTVGWHAMRIAAAAITALFLLWVPVYGAGDLRTGGFAAYSTLADLVAETLLGIGMILVLSEEGSRRLAEAVRDLARARDEAEAAARLDPLTEAFNRAAFRVLTSRTAGPAGDGGSVVMLDVDFLKPINDREGHAAGDEALRAVARAIRALVRPEDLLFRWGGDEFLVVLPSVGMDAATARFAPLEAGVPLEGGRLVSVSWGAAAYANDMPIQGAIARADQAMYASRAARRARAG
jgi:diguanylate cyclase (GGDEF)-like protein